MTEFKAKETLDGVFETDIRLGFNDVTVTPGIAEKALELNYSGQRRLSGDNVSQRARDMQAGRWRGMETATAIQVTPDGVLIDGQHTLNAVIAADMPVEMHVFVGGTVDCFDVIDSGRVRSVSSRLGNIKSSDKVAAVARRLTCLEFGASLTQAINGQIPRAGTLAGKARHPSQAEVLDFCHRCMPKLGFYVKEADCVYRATGKASTPSNVGTFLALEDAAGKMDDALLFLDDLCSVPPSTTAAFVTWRAMTNAAAGRKSRAGAASAADDIGFLLKGFDAFDKGREIKLIRKPEESVSKFDVSVLDFSRWEGEPEELAV